MKGYSEYLIQGEPNQRDRARNWMAAIGLQDVDGLIPSNYMLNAVRRNIEGEITIDEVGKLVDEYYMTQEGMKQEARTLEADKVAVRIAKILSHQTFSLGSNYLALIHRNLFEGIYKFAGTYRVYNNALVRANYSNIQYGVKETTEYLERFFRNLLMGEKNELKSRYMIMGTSWKDEESTQEISMSTQEISMSTQERIIEEIRKHPFITRDQLAKVIGITPDGIKKQLDKLKKAGKIRHVGATKKGHWEIVG